MAYTGAQVIKAALQRILVQASEADLEADEYQDAILALNAMMASWESDGIRLGYTPIDSIADEITVPPGAIRGIIANLALEVAPDYNGVVSAALASQANDGMRICRKLGVRIIPTQYPTNLPKGSGYEDEMDYIDPFFEAYDDDFTYYRVKDPDDVIPVHVDWLDKLNLSDPADTISSSSWSADSGLTVDSDSNTTTSATAVISGGTAGNRYKLTNRIVTAAGYTYDRSTSVAVRES